MKSDAAIGRRLFTAALAGSPLAVMAGSVSASPSQSQDTSKGFFDAEREFPGRRPARLAMFDLSEVRLLDGPCKLSRDWSLAYMKRLPVDRLLHSFRLNAGIPSEAKPLGGWEAPACELRGHFVGHYLSACAIAFRATGDSDFRDRGHAIVAGLAQCQDRLSQGGYLSAFPISLFDRLDAGKEVWAPFYTLHKIMVGLLDMHELAGDPQALAVLLGMARWMDGWTAARDDKHMQAILNTEYGGMNDVFYRLAATTNDPRWIGVGDRFTKKKFFNPLAERRDELRGLHMNTHVPQVIGAARRHELTGDPRFHEVARFFYETVTESRTYAPGGSSNGEHWLSAPNRLAEEWAKADSHQECCCSYNMMKLAGHLFSWQPHADYMDYYERNLLNHRLGMIEPGTGRSSYFLSMSSGAWKTFASEEDSFWCCNGTALEEYARIGGMIYANDGSGIYVNLFVASELEWKARRVVLRQETDFPAKSNTKIIVQLSPGGTWALRLRIPGWTAGRAAVFVNGVKIDGMAVAGSYLELSRRWKSGDVIELDLPMSLAVEPFSDSAGTAAISYGPIVLAQQLPRGDIPLDLAQAQGPDLSKAPPPQRAASLPADVVDRLERQSGEPLAFTLAYDGQTIVFKPLSDSWDRFAVYCPIALA